MPDLPTTQAALLLRIVDRQDVESWEEFVRLYTPVLKRVALGRGFRHLDADELVQDVFVAVMKSIEKFKHNNRRGSFRRWLMTLARNAAINRISRQPIDLKNRSHAYPLDRLNCSDDRPDAIDQSLHAEWQSELLTIACGAVQSLVQPLTWAAFWKTAIEGCSAEVVAKELGLSVGAVYVARSRTLAKVKLWVSQHSAIWEQES